MVLLFSCGVRVYKQKEYYISYFFSLFSRFFLYLFLYLLFVAIPSSFIGIFPFLISLARLPLAGSFWDIFPPSIGFPGVLIIKQYFWEVSVLFRLSFMYLMWKRLGREALINVEVMTSMTLILLGGFSGWY